MKQANVILKLVRKCAFDKQYTTNKDYKIFEGLGTDYTCVLSAYIICEKPPSSDGDIELTGKSIQISAYE